MSAITVEFSQQSWYRILTYVCLASYIPHALAASKRCFDYNGNELSAQRALPCSPDSAKDGPCCAPGDICLSNGLCKPGPELTNIGMTDTYKPTCTDGTWTVDTCFSGCNGFDGYGMKQCGDNRFCCFVNNSTSSGCDCDRTSLFELDAATFLTTLPINTILSTSTSLPASASASTTSASDPLSTSASSSPSAQSSSQPSSHNAAIGAGIGAGIGVPLLAAVGVLAWYLHKRHKSRKAALHHGGSYPIHELKDSTTVGYKQMASANELSADRRYEMDAINPSQEIDGIPKYRRDA